ncbi:MAG: hypothetical protein O8C61_04365 [Candidatus Methanoperedens sp.]|nr:hypothetical protein [Candidatus Methanoperedens sp.]
MPELIVIESICLARDIQSWAYGKNIKIKILHHNRAKIKTLFNQLSNFVKIGNFMNNMLLRLCASYITGMMNQGRKINTIQPVIVDTYVHNNSFSENGSFKDRYFPYLHEFLSKKGLCVLVHPVLSGFGYNYFSIYLKMRKCKTHFILRENFLRFSDYISVMVFPFKTLKQKIKAEQFLGFDLDNILKEELKVKLTTSGMEAMLIYHLFLRLGQSGLQPGLIINWYENQAIDKGLIAGVRKAFPHSEIIGAQMFIHSPNFISLFPSQSEADAGLVPNILLETSQYQCQVARAFTRTIPCYPAAALRYSHVFKEKIDDFKQEPDKILILLSFNIAEGVELLETLNEVLEQIRGDVPLLIKPHPDYKNEELIQAFGEYKWPKRFVIYKGNLPDALEHASMVVGSNSGSMVEAAAKGIPVIFLARQTALNQNILANLNLDIITECFSPAELVEAIEKYLDLDQNEKTRYMEMGRKVRSIFFTPVNEETLLPFLGIKKDR